MDVNSISNNINSLNTNTNNNHINKNSSTQKIDNNDDFLKLSINDYNKQRDELSLSLQSFNEGIAITKIANIGLEKEQEILQNINEKLNQIKDDNSSINDKNIFKNEINQDLFKFKEEAYQTKYKNENLIIINEYEENYSIDISTKETYFSIDKPNTPEIAIELAKEVSKNDFNSTDQLQATINKVENSSHQLQNLKDQFTDLGNKLESSARTSIKDQIDLSNKNRAGNEINFGKEASDFSKTNIQANVGYLAAAQANIIQEQSVRLLT
ncbi:MAG: hypothetical protein GY932_03095 [Arcobacter sp.]|nr:hypothetical protein [Arcobacter sp.]